MLGSTSKDDLERAKNCKAAAATPLAAESRLTGRHLLIYSEDMTKMQPGQRYSP